MGLEKITAAAAELGTAFDAAQNGIIVINLDSEITFCNKAAARFIGDVLANIIGRKINEVIPDSELSHVMVNGKPQSDRVFIQNRMFITNRSPVFKDGRLVGAVAIFQDGSELQSMLAQLNQTQSVLNSLENIFEHAYDGVVVVDRDGMITRITNAYCRFLQVSPDQAVGKHVTEIIPNSRMHIIAQTGEAEIGHAMKVREKEAIVMRVPLWDDGKLVGAVGKVMFRDVQELRTLAEKLNLLEHKLKFYETELQRYQQYRYTFVNIIGQSESLHKAKNLAEKAAQSRTTVLLRGESGTGKEMFAQAIHAAGSRQDKAFVRVNCGAIPSELLEAELFGYDEGAFTGAKKGGKPGKFELANGGTIFLDEIGDLPLAMQAKVLRVLQEKEIERVGSNRLLQLDIRVIAATHRDLEKMVSSGEFRRDLYYRLNVFTITIPPLRERPGDVLLVSEYLLKKYQREVGSQATGLEKPVEELFRFYPWPGNIRELQNSIERALNVSEGDKISLDDLPLYLRERADRAGNLELKTLEMELAETERRAIIKALNAAGGNKAKAASLLGIHRTNLYRKMEKYLIGDPRENGV